MFLNVLDSVRKILRLASPFGRGKLVTVFIISMFQGLMQVAGVTSIFPFLTLVADSSLLYKSSIGLWFVESFPSLSEKDFLLLAGACSIVVLLLSNVVNFAADYVRNRYAYSFGHWLRIELVRSFARRPYAFFLKQNSGVLIKKSVMDVYNFSSGVLLPLLDVISRFITCVLLILTLILVDPVIALGSSFLVAGVYVGIFFIQKPLRRRISEGLKISNRGNMVAVQQLFSGIKSILVHQKQDYFIERVERHSVKQAKYMAITPLLGTIPRYVIEPLAYGGLVLFLSLRLASGGDISELIPVIGVMALAGYRLIPAVQLLYAQMSQIGTQIHALEEVYDEFYDPSFSPIQGEASDCVSQDSKLSFDKEIRFQDVSYEYDESEGVIFENVNIAFNKGSCLGVVGVTGSGKSTLINLLLGLHQPTSGMILVDDKPLVSEQLANWRMLIGYVPQDIFLVDASIAENIAFGVSVDEIDKGRVREVAKLAQIDNFIENLPRAYETEVGERGERLSGGQKQRIGIARALYHRPSILILDEATSALDADTEQSVMTAVSSLMSEMTIIQISHRPATMQICDHLILVKDGAVTLSKNER